MSLTPDQVRDIAHLARLQIDEDRIPAYAETLSRILDFVDQLNDADTGQVAPMAHPLAASQRLRADEVTEPDQRAAAQANAPRVEDGLYLVPRVIE